MEKSKKIFWLTSYPKSGNTWIRLILCALFFTKEGNLNDFKILTKIPKFDVLKNFEFVKNISNKDYLTIFNKSDKYNQETLKTYSKYWAEAEKRITITDGQFGFFKTHNGRIKVDSNLYANISTTAGFLYIYRDPRDIVISYAKHLQKSTDFTVDYLVNGQIIGNDKEKDFLPEITLNWGDHYLSWKKFKEVPSIYIKYENLLENPDKEINNIIKFFYNNYNVKIDNKDLKIKNIVQSTGFKNLVKLEKKYDFKERLQSKKFFRVGKKNQWKDNLDQDKVAIIENKFNKIMKELNYL